MIPVDIFQQLIEGVFPACELVDKPPVHITKAKEGSDLFLFRRGLRLMKVVYIGLVDLKRSWFDQILTLYKWKTFLVYVDDVIIYSNTLDDHIHHVDEILTTLAEAGVTLKINKFHFFQKEVEYLGHMVKTGTLQIDKTNVNSLRQAKPTTNKTQVRSLSLIHI